MRAGFEYYRALPQDAIQNQNYSQTKLTMPVLTLQGGFVPAFGGNVTMSSIEYGMRMLAQNVTSVTVPNSGHWIAEEQPEFLATLLNDFFGRITTTTNSTR
jgi:pimeloyl-ACP methyl ester carboxylesterase